MNIQPPIVYVSEKTAWEYRQVSRSMSEGKAPTEEELNKLGKEGWELAGVFIESGTVHFYFKRPTD